LKFATTDLQHMVAVSDLHKWLYELLQPINRL